MKSTLKGFSFEQVNTLKDELEVLKKELAVSVLQDYAPGLLQELERHSARIKVLTNEVLLDIFSDKTRDLQIKGLPQKCWLQGKHRYLFPLR